MLKKSSLYFHCVSSVDPHIMCTIQTIFLWCKRWWILFYFLFLCDLNHKRDMFPTGMISNHIAVSTLALARMFYPLIPGYIRWLTPYKSKFKIEHIFYIFLFLLFFFILYLLWFDFRTTAPTSKEESKHI